MITKEEAYAYLSRITDAKKTLGIYLRPDEAMWSRDNVYYLYSDEPRLHIIGTQKLAEAIGHPYMLSYYSENADKLSFHWNGIEIFELRCGKNKRIGTKP